MALSIIMMKQHSEVVYTMNERHNRNSDEAGKAIQGLFDLAGLLGASMEHELTALGLTRARAEVVWRLSRQGRMKQADLSDALKCTPRNVTGLLDALEASGLVERLAHPADRRATLVALTPQGERASATWDRGHRSMSERIFSGIDPDDLHRFVKVLDHVRGILREAEPSDA